MAVAIIHFITERLGGLGDCSNIFIPLSLYKIISQDFPGALRVGVDIHFSSGACKALVKFPYQAPNLSATNQEAVGATWCNMRSQLDTTCPNLCHRINTVTGCHRFCERPTEPVQDTPKSVGTDT